MDAIAYKEMFDFKHSGKLPEGISRNAKIVFRRKAKNFIIQNEVLHYVRRKEGGALAKVVCTKEKAKYIFMELHNSAIGAHCGIHKTLDAVSRRFYWPGMSVDIKKWITHCAACQQKQRSLKNQTQYTPIEVAEPWEIVGMDLVGKLTPTKDGYQYICVMVDYFTKWCEAFPLKSKRAEEVTECIIKLFYKFGAPKRLLTDQGTEFVNQINLEVCQTLGISRSLCAPYHPQTNGLVERLNGTIQRTLSKLVERKPSSWADYLEATMFGLRTKKQLTTKFSPYFLLFGREARYPCEVPDKYEINESVEELIAEECISECVKRRDRLYQVVKENMAQVHAKIKKRKLQGKARILQVGDRVLRQNIRSQQRKGGKLDLDYVGPYTVLNVDDKSIDLIDDNGKIYPKVNLDHLVHFQEEPPTKAPKVTYVTTSLPASMPSVPVLTPVTVKCPSFQTHLTFTHPVTLPITQFSLHHLTLPFTLPIVSSQSHTMTQPGSSLPAASKPASSLPAASKPASSLPAASKPVSFLPAASKPASSLPAASKPVSFLPAASKPASSLPAASKPVSFLPAASKPVSFLPAASKPASSLPAASKPASSLPAASKPASSLPAASKPASSLPAASKPASSLPAASKPVSSLPAASKPVSSLPAASKPASSLPAASKPASSLPAASKPVSSLPAASKPASSLPAASKPASSLPAASKPASSLPAASKPASSLPAASQLTLLHDIWAGKIGGRIWSKIGPYKLFSMDLERLRPGEELESEVINAYLACLAKSYAGHAFVIDSFQMTKMWNGKACLMKRTDLQKYDLLLGSVNETHHWTLLLIYPQQGRIIYMNSLGEGSNKLVHCCKAVRDFMDHKGFQGTTWKCVTLPHNLQPDSNSCGVFVCKFAEAILTGGNLNFSCDPENIAVMREDIGQRLLNESEDLSDSCLACGNEYPYTEDKVDTWIECDRCSGWYHWDCMSRPSIEAVFICPGCQGPF